MAAFRLTRLAESDLLNVGEYTLRTWGEAQTIKYLDELESACRQLASMPTSGRPCDDVRAGLYRREVGKHVVFYRIAADGILIVRILHRTMFPERHAFNEGDTGIH